MDDDQTLEFVKGETAAQPFGDLMGHVDSLVMEVLSLLNHAQRQHGELADLLAAPDRTIDILIYVQSLEREKTIKYRIGGEQPLPPP